MRIGIDARFFGGEQSKGLGRYTQKLIEYLAKHDHENEYVVFLQTESFENWSCENENFTPIHAPYHWYSFAEQLWMPVKIMQANVDFMHFPHFNVPLLYRKPFVVTIHDLIINHFPTERATTLGPLLYRIKHFAGQLVMHHAVKYSSHIITVSEFSKKDIVNYYSIDENKVSVTYEAAELEHSTGEDIENNTKKSHKLEPTETLKKYHIEKPYILYVGNAYPHKNLEILLDVMKELKATRNDLPLRMVFVGKEDYFYSRLKQEAWARDVDDRVIFTGFVPDAHLPVLYELAVAYIFPSLYEGFGLPPLEAMSYGAPVLAARTSCLPEILGDAALYFDPQDVSGIIDAIISILDNPRLYTELTEKGHRQTQRYSWKRMMEQTLVLYGEFKKTEKQKRK